MEIIIISAVLDLVTFASVLFICYKYIVLRKQKDSEYYTDYVHNNLILRIFKPEFEWKAIEKVPREKLLDRGTFSQFYNWVLIEK